jgi:hypothetical protein
LQIPSLFDGLFQAGDAHGELAQGYLRDIGIEGAFAI